jgi:hypothetical protein
MDDNLLIDLENPELTDDQKTNTMNRFIEIQSYLNDSQKNQCKELFGILKDIEISTYHFMNREAIDLMFSTLTHIEDNVVEFDENDMQAFERQNRLFPPNQPGVISKNLQQLRAIATREGIPLYVVYINELLRLQIANYTFMRNNQGMGKKSKINHRKSKSSKSSKRSKRSKRNHKKSKRNKK